MCLSSVARHINSYTKHLPQSVTIARSLSCSITFLEGKNGNKILNIQLVYLFFITKTSNQNLELAWNSQAVSNLPDGCLL